MSIKKRLSTLNLFSFTFALLFFISNQTVTAQIRSAYIPFFRKDTTWMATLVNDYKQSILRDVKIPSNADKKIRTAYEKIQTDVVSDFKAKVSTEFINDTLLTPYLQTTLNQFIKDNKELSGARIFIVRNPEANAYAVGGKFLIVNTGLIARLKDEGQLAFIICHELAHNYFEHFSKGINQRIETYYNPDFQKEIKKTLNEEYNTYKKFNTLLRTFSFKSLYHSRQLEKQADSLAYLFLSKAPYNLESAESALTLLDTIDAPVSSKTIDYKELFNCSIYPYNEELNPVVKTSIFDQVKTDVPKEIQDSLKTHPDCIKRIDYLKQIQAVSSKKENITTSFEQIKFACIIETIESFYQLKRYDHCLFNALLYLEKYPANDYLKTMVSVCLFQLHKHMVNHTLSTVVGTSGKFNPDNFNNFIEFINNLRINDIVKLNKCFVDQHPINNQNTEYKAIVNYLTSLLTNDTASATSIKQTHFAEINNGRFSYLFN